MKAYINNIEYALLRDFDLTDQSGNKTTSTISVLIDDQPWPVAGDVIELRQDDKTLFWGLCGIPKTPKYKTGLEKRIVEIKCTNANAILSNRICNVAYQNVTVSQVVQNLFDAYISTEGVSLGAISEIPITLEVYTAKDYNLQEALDELAELVGAVWRVDNDHRFYFLAEENFPVFPRTINQNFLLGAELQHSTKDYKTRTVQYISGATDYTSTQSETFTYQPSADGTEQAFITAFPVAKKPTIYVNGTQLSPSQVGVNGINSQDAGIVFLFSFSSTAVSYVQNSAYLTAGDTVRIDYTGIFPIRVSVANDVRISQIAAATGTSGRREMVQLATSVTTQADAIQMAQALLDQFSTATGEVKFWLTSDQLYELGMTLDDVDLLTQMTFDLPDLGITGDYVIVERKLKPFYGNLDNIETKLRVDLRLQNRDFLKSYGETLSNLRKDVNQLAVRADDIVINVQAQPERLVLSEIMLAFEPFAFYPVAASTDSALFAPLPLGADVYPDI